MPIFNAGRSRATVRVAEVDRDLAVTAYERTIEVGFVKSPTRLRIAARSTNGSTRNSRWSRRPLIVIGSQTRGSGAASTATSPSSIRSDRPTRRSRIRSPFAWRGRRTW